MYYILPFFLFVSVIITNFFYSVSTSCVDSAIDSISKATFKECIRIKDDVSEETDIDDFYIDKQRFEELYLEQFNNNLDYYQGDIEVAFAYYNVKQHQECDEINLVCNGVQIKISVKPFSFIPVNDKYIRYEIKDNNLT
jgi:hypothetical protein